MKKKILFVGVLIVCAGIGADYYYANGQYVGKYIGLGDAAERDYFALDEAQEMDRSGDTTGANKIYRDLIKTTDDDIVLERSIREYGRNLQKTDSYAGIQQTIKLASNPRIRASARAGAIENLARTYVLGEGIRTEDLDNIIFADMPLSAIKARASSITPSYVVLLEYGNNLSVRPLATAILAEYYAKQLYKGNTGAQVDLEESLANLDQLLPGMSETSPNKPLTYSYLTSALLYASAAGVPFEGRYADQTFAQAINASGQILTFIQGIVDADATLGWSKQQLALLNLAPEAQFSIVFKTLTSLPTVNSAEGIVDVYNTYTQKGDVYDDELLKLYEALTEQYGLDNDQVIE